MDITVLLPENEEIVEVPTGATVFDLLGRLKLYPDAVLVFRVGKVLPEDETIFDGDTIRIMKIASGG